MPLNDFKPGYARYHTETISELPAYLFKAECWQNGFYDFSTQEVKLDKMDFTKTDRGFNFYQDIIDESLGFLTGIDLWNGTCENGINEYFEICVERNDKAFFFQEWRLSIGQTPEKKNGFFKCYYRQVPTKQGRFFTRISFEDQELESYEIIIPEKRFHFYIIKGTH